MSKAIIELEEDCLSTHRVTTEIVPYVTKSKRIESVSYETISLSHETYEALHSAFEHFNQELFCGLLPQCILTIRKKRGAHGFYHKGQFESKDGSACLDEIALNPESFKRDEIKAISTLVHEMVHLWQNAFGSPSRSAYHNKEWADAMEAVGLMPSTTGEPGGKRTGQQCSHYIINGGRYEVAYHTWPMRGKITWAAIVRESQPRGKSNKTKYVCSCGNQVWGRPSLSILCAECKGVFQEISKETP